MIENKIVKIQFNETKLNKTYKAYRWYKIVWIVLIALILTALTPIIYLITALAYFTIEEPITTLFTVALTSATTISYIFPIIFILILLKNTKQVVKNIPSAKSEIILSNTDIILGNAQRIKWEEITKIALIGDEITILNKDHDNQEISIVKMATIGQINTNILFTTYEAKALTTGKPTSTILIQTKNKKQIQHIPLAPYMDTIEEQNMLETINYYTQKYQIPLQHFSENNYLNSKLMKQDIKNYLQNNQRERSF